MTLRRRLLLSFTGVASLILLIGVAGIIISIQVAGAFGVVLTNTAPALSSILNASGAAGIIRESAYRYAYQMTNLGGVSQADLDLIAVNKTRLRTELDAYRLVGDPAAHDRILTAAEVLFEEVDELIRLTNSGLNNIVIGAQIGVLGNAQANFSVAINDELNALATQSTTEIESAGRGAITGAVVYVLTMIGGVIVAIVLGVIVSRQIVSRVRQLQGVTEKMMNGNYAQRANMTTRDEIGQLGGAFDIMAETIEKRDEALNTANQSLEKRVDERTRELRIATREAQEASRLKDEFLSIMSHELRTPLNAIIGFQGIVLMGGKLDDRGKHMITRAQENANRLLALINDILDVSRIESGRLQLVKNDVAPAALLSKLESQMSVLAEQKNLAFDVELDSTVPQTIYFDEDALTKIMVNLLGNAFKFTDQGKVTLRMRSDVSNLVIEVEDTGVGIPSHLHQVIFERFRQVDGSSKRAYGGSGLGLAIVQKLAQAMNGTVQIRSAVGEGSTFTVVLPMEMSVNSDRMAVEGDGVAL